MAENNLREVSANRLQEAVRKYGLQKQLASDLMLSDTEVSRLINDHAPKLIALMTLLGLEVVSSDYVDSLKKILRESL